MPVTQRHAARSGSRNLRHARRASSHHVLRTVGLVMTAVVAFGVTGAAAAYSQLQGNITGVDVDNLLGNDRPTPITTPDPSDPNKGLPVNILILGSDTREGQAIKDDGTKGQRSDTTIVLHISADRQRDRRSAPEVRERRAIRLIDWDLDTMWKARLRRGGKREEIQFGKCVEVRLAHGIDQRVRIDHAIEARAFRKAQHRGELRR